MRAWLGCGYVQRSGGKSHLNLSNQFVGLSYVRESNLSTRTAGAPGYACENRIRRLNVNTPQNRLPNRHKSCCTDIVRALDYIRIWRSHMATSATNPDDRSELRKNKKEKRLFHHKPRHT